MPFMSPSGLSPAHITEPYLKLRRRLALSHGFELRPVVGTRQCRGRSRLAAATSALLVGLQCRRLGELLVVFLSSFFPEGQAFWMAFLQWLMPGLSSPLPLLVRKRCSSPPFLTLLSTATSLDAGLSSAQG